MKREIKGMLTGLGITFRTMTRPAVTVQYPHEREDPSPRARGVIALKEENCTVCMLCARSCPDWCIYIEGHKEQRPPRREGGKPRNVSVLDRFEHEFAALAAEPGVRLPGDRRLASRAVTTNEGVEVDEELFATLTAYAEHGSPAGR